MLALTSVWVNLFTFELYELFHISTSTALDTFNAEDPFKVQEERRAP